MDRTVEVKEEETADGKFPFQPVAAGVWLKLPPPGSFLSSTLKRSKARLGTLRLCQAPSRERVTPLAHFSSLRVSEEASYLQGHLFPNHRTDNCPPADPQRAMN